MCIVWSSKGHALECPGALYTPVIVDVIYIKLVHWCFHISITSSKTYVLVPPKVFYYLLGPWYV